MPDSLKYYTHTRTRMHTQNLSVYLYMNAIIFHVSQNKQHLGSSALQNPRSSGDAATAEEARQGGREQRSFPAVLPDLQPLRGGGKKGLLPASTGWNSSVNMCPPLFTGAYDLPLGNSVISCVALLIPQGAGALSS